MIGIKNISEISVMEPNRPYMVMHSVTSERSSKRAQGEKDRSLSHKRLSFAFTNTNAYRNQRSSVQEGELLRRNNAAEQYEHDPLMSLLGKDIRRRNLFLEVLGSYDSRGVGGDTQLRGQRQ